MLIAVITGYNENVFCVSFIEMLFYGLFQVFHVFYYIPRLPYVCLLFAILCVASVFISLIYVFLSGQYTGNLVVVNYMNFENNV